MKSTPKPPPGDDPVYCEFIAEWITAQERDQSRYIIETLGGLMSRNMAKILIGIAASVVAAVLVVGVTGGSPLEVGLGIVIGIFIGTILTIALTKGR